MSEEDREPNDPPEVSKPLKEHIRVGPVEAEDPTIEWDPEDRFHRYDEIIARGRFKTVYRGYDTENGIDVAWCQVQDPDPHTSAHNLKPIYNEMKKGLNLDHSNIIRCFACWLDSENQRINLITELFTSGTLRSYIEMYSNVDLNVHRKYVRQILSGLTYLHSRVPPVIHADLRLDKIYVNGFNGEVKIGDLGLATLLTKRYHPSQPPEFDSPLEDLRALGVCVYELLTGKRLDPRNRTQWNDSLKEVKDSDAHNFLSKCFGMSHSVTAVELLEHPFLKLRSSKFKVKNGNDLNINRLDSQQSIAAKLRGEDWNFDLQVKATLFRFSDFS